MLPGICTTVSSEVCVLSEMVASHVPSTVAREARELQEAADARDLLDPPNARDAISFRLLQLEVFDISQTSEAGWQVNIHKTFSQAARASRDDPANDPNSCVLQISSSCCKPCCCCPSIVSRPSSLSLSPLLSTAVSFDGDKSRMLLRRRSSASFCRHRYKYQLNWLSICNTSRGS